MTSPRNLHGASPSTRSRGATAHALQQLRPAARGAGRARGRRAASPVPVDGKLPAYCERAPAELLDDGWSSETSLGTHETTDGLSLEAADDFDLGDCFDSGGIEDSR